jgi:hypothetical protein
MMCKGASVRDTTPGASSRPPAIAGVSSQELREQRHDIIDPEGQTHADLEHAGRLAAVGRHACNRGLQLLQIALDRVQEALAGFRQSELARAAVKQPDTEIPLQHGDVAAHRGRSERQPPRRCREAAGFRTSHEGFEIRERLHGQTFKQYL